MNKIDTNLIVTGNIINQLEKGLYKIIVLQFYNKLVFFSYYHQILDFMFVKKRKENELYPSFINRVMQDFIDEFPSSKGKIVMVNDLYNMTKLKSYFFENKDFVNSKHPLNPLSLYVATKLATSFEGIFKITFNPFSSMYNKFSYYYQRDEELKELVNKLWSDETDDYNQIRRAIKNRKKRIRKSLEEKILNNFENNRLITLLRLFNYDSYSGFFIKSLLKYIKKREKYMELQNSFKSEDKKSLIEKILLYSNKKLDDYVFHNLHMEKYNKILDLIVDIDYDDLVNAFNIVYLNIGNQDFKLNYLKDSIDSNRIIFVETEAPINSKITKTMFIHLLKNNDIEGEIIDCRAIINQYDFLNSKRDKEYILFLDFYKNENVVNFINSLNEEELKKNNLKIIISTMLDYFEGK